ncbi:MAG TPA: hypothetical protein DEQ38_05655 [Elusimicrobia bacterium]|nr:MAG: hypothetical protein A2089_13360 [Elusimicrobia bacterium GWD2_63_28]HCC47586.1 hypothetical protein [Elusimicrobiota bacterium]
MKNLSLLFLAAFTAWAVAVVGKDLATRKIPNASIKTGLQLLAAALLVFGAYTWLGYYGRVQSFLNLNFYWLLCLHLFWTILAGVLLWYAEIWPAGDAKFFILVSAALPLANPYLKNFPSFLFLSLLINIFVAAAFWAVGSHIASGFASASPSDFFAEMWRDVKNRLGSLAAGSGKLAAGAYVLNLGFLFLLQQVMSMEARGFLSRFFSRADLLFFFLFILWDKVGEVFRSRRWVIVTAVCYLLYFFLGYFLFRERLWLLLTAAVTNVIKFSLLLFAGRFMLEFLMERKDTVCLTAAELEPGVVLTSKAAREFKANPVFDGLFDDCFKDGLTAEQTDAVKDWLKKLPVRDPKVETVRGRPFALWIFAGAALLLALDRNIAGLLK